LGVAFFFFLANFCTVATKAVIRKFWKFWFLSVNYKKIAKILEKFAKPVETTKFFIFYF
jgi:hypothetical protein